MTYFDYTFKPIETNPLKPINPLENNQHYLNQWINSIDTIEKDNKIKELKEENLKLKNELTIIKLAERLKVRYIFDKYYHEENIQILQRAYNTGEYFKLIASLDVEEIERILKDGYTYDNIVMTLKKIYEEHFKEKKPLYKGIGKDKE